MRATNGTTAGPAAAPTPAPGTAAAPGTATATDPAAKIPPVQQRRSALRRLFARLAADTDELQADELQEEIKAGGATPISTCPDREQVCLVGTLRTVTFRPRAGVPALEAELWDGTGTVTVVFLGRRQIPGIDPGRIIKLRGRVTTLRGHRAIYNPIYTLKGNAAE
jgi:hypothetical protein